MTLRNILQIFSFVVLFYLLVDSIMYFDIAATLNNGQTRMQKAEVESTQTIEAVKQKAKDSLDTIRRIHKNYSNKSVINFWLIAGLIAIQAFLFFNKNPKVDIKNNGR